MTIFLLPLPPEPHKPKRRLLVGWLLCRGHHDTQTWVEEAGIGVLAEVICEGCGKVVRRIYACDPSVKEVDANDETGIEGHGSHAD